MKAGHQVTVITSSTTGTPSTEKTGGLNIYRLRSVKYPKLKILHNADLYYSLFFENFASIVRILRRRRVDVVQVYGQFFDLTFLAIFAAKMLRLPIVLTIGTRMEHFSVVLYDTLLRLIDKTLVKHIVARRVDRIIAMDKLMRDYIKDRYNLSSSVVRFIPAGVDVERFQRVSGNRVRSLYGLSLRDPIILSLGTVSSLRTANGLLKALPRVLRQFASVRLLFVGALYDKGPLELVKKLRLDNSVIFCGRIDYQMIPSYVGASDVEGHDLDTGLGIGLASLEAMAAGRAVLSSGRRQLHGA